MRVVCVRRVPVARRHRSSHPAADARPSPFVSVARSLLCPRPCRALRPSPAQLPTSRSSASTSGRTSGNIASALHVGLLRSQSLGVDFHSIPPCVLLSIWSLGELCRPFLLLHQIKQLRFKFVSLFYYFSAMDAPAHILPLRAATRHAPRTL